MSNRIHISKLAQISPYNMVVAHMCPVFLVKTRWSLLVWRSTSKSSPKQLHFRQMLSMQVYLIISKIIARKRYIIIRLRLMLQMFILFKGYTRIRLEIKFGIRRANSLWQPCGSKFSISASILFLFEQVEDNFYICFFLFT